MLVFSKIIYGMILGLALILVSELCLANQDNKEFIDDKLNVDNHIRTIYNFDNEISLVGAYRHYEDEFVEADRVFVGFSAKF